MRLASIRGLFAALSFGFNICAAAEPARPDFNGDDFDDLVVSVSKEDVGTLVDAGAVNVLYGSANGIVESGNQFWHKDKPGVPGTAAAGDLFGTATAWGDFDNDGFSDLAVSALGEDDFGAVYVFYGSSIGLTSKNADRWRQGVNGVPGTAHAEDSFGSALIAGDFDGDGFHDLAISASRDRIAGVQAGSVTILRGGMNGLKTIGAQVWHLNRAGVPDECANLEGFGFALTVGDFNNDSHDDLAISAPGETSGGEFNAGVVHVLFGSSTGLSADDTQFWNQTNIETGDSSEANDGFGYALSAGDYDGDGFDDLAIGVPLEDFAGNADAGVVHVLYGGLAGLNIVGAQRWHLNSAGLDGVPHADDLFGITLASGDFNFDGRTDLAIGVPGGFAGLFDAAGTVQVLYGRATGLGADGNRLLSQHFVGIADTAEADDFFGSGVFCADFDGDTFADLVVAVPSEDISGIQNCGAINVIYGSSVGGLSAEGDQFWHQNVGAIKDQCETNDGFGIGVF